MIANLAMEKDKFRLAAFRDPSVDAMNDKGETDLHLAARLNLPGLTLSLLDHGANVNATGPMGHHTAARCG